MKYGLGSFLFLALAGCTDVTPQVSKLRSPISNSVSESSFVQADVSAATVVRSTAGGYTGKVLVHSGNNARSARTTGGDFELQIRKISY